MVATQEVEVSDRVLLWRGWLITLGVLLLAIGGATFLKDVNPADYPGVAAWLAGAIIVHDGVGAIAVFAVTALVRRIDHRVSFAMLAIAQGAAAVAVIVTVIVVPEIVKQAIGSANASILPLDYFRNLLLFYLGLAAAVSVTSVVVALRRRRRATVRPATERTK